MIAMVNSKAKVSALTVGATGLVAAVAAVAGEWMCSAVCVAGSGMAVVEYLGFAGRNDT